MHTQTTRPLLNLSLILIIKAFLILFVIFYAGIGLAPDEAQYWTWSHLLDWGYYSKPPAIAWQIWLGTQIFGDTELGVRFIAIILNVALCFAVYALARACQLSKNTAFWAGTVMALSPMGILGSFLATTDGGMLLFWTLSCILIAKALTEQEKPNYYAIGLLIAAGALFKWPIYFLWLLILVFVPIYRVLASRHLLGGILLSLIGLFPSVIWNWSHNWVTFRHVSATVVGQDQEIGRAAFTQGNPLDFLGAQIALLSPIWFVLLILAFISLVRQRKQLRPALVFCGATSLIPLLIVFGLSFFQKMQGNWVVYAYPTAIVFLCWYACESLLNGKRWLQAGLILSVLLTAIALSIPSIQSHNLFASHPIPYKVNPFKHNVGWENLNPLLTKAGYNPEEHFLFGDKYQMSSLLSFYAPDQKRAYFLNLHAIRLNQFSFWPSMAQEQKGKTGFFVLSENSPHLERNLSDLIAFYEKTLPLYFSEVHYLGLFPLFESNGELAKGALIFKCVGYNSQEPASPQRY